MNRSTLDQAIEHAKELGRQLKQEIPEGWGFCLVLASYGEGGFMTYLSSVEREAAMKMLRKLLTKWENNDPHVEDVN